MLARSANKFALSLLKKIFAVIRKTTKCLENWLNYLVEKFGLYWLLSSCSVDMLRKWPTSAEIAEAKRTAIPCGLKFAGYARSLGRFTHSFPNAEQIVQLFLNHSSSDQRYERLFPMCSRSRKKERTTKGKPKCHG